MENKNICLCCGYQTLPASPADCIGFICPVCFWENDVFMKDMHDCKEKSDCNHGMTLEQARENFKKYATCAQRFLGYVRKPKPTEIP